MSNLKGKNILYIGDFNSRCSNCGEGASLDESYHITRLSYKINDRNTIGCEAKFDYWTLETFFSNMSKEKELEIVERLKKEHPNLKKIKYYSMFD